MSNNADISGVSWPRVLLSQFQFRARLTQIGCWPYLVDVLTICIVPECSKIHWKLWHRQTHFACIMIALWKMSSRSQTARCIFSTDSPTFQREKHSRKCIYRKHGCSCILADNVKARKACEWELVLCFKINGGHGLMYLKAVCRFWSLVLELVHAWTS